MPQFEDLPRPNATLSELIRAGRAGASSSGVAGAHAIGSAFASVKLPDLMPLLDRYGIGINASPNGAPFPDSMRGGATLGLANHGNQLTAYNSLQAEEADNIGEATEIKFFDFITRRLEALTENESLTADQLAAEQEAIVRDVYIYQRVLEFESYNQNLLNQMGFSDTVSLPWNNSDWRAGTPAFSNLTASDYLAQPAIANSQQYEVITQTKLWKYLDSIVPQSNFGAADFAIRDQILADHPEYARTWRYTFTPTDYADILVDNQLATAASTGAGNIDRQLYYTLSQGSEAQTLAAKAEVLARALGDDALQATSLSDLANTYARKFGATQALTELTLAYKNFAADVVDVAPPQIAQNFRDLITRYSEDKAGAVDPATSLKATTAVGLALLVAGEAWAQYVRHKDDPGGFTAWLKTASANLTADFLSPTSIAAFVVLGAPGVGEVLFLPLAGALALGVLQNVLHTYVVAYPTPPGASESVTHSIARTLDSFLTTTEASLAKYVDMGLKYAAKAAAQVVNPLIESYVGSSLQAANGDGVAIGGSAGGFIFGTDVSTIIGGDGNALLIQTGAGRATGGKGDDTLIGWNAPTIHKGEALDSTIRLAEEEAVAKYQAAYSDWQLGGKQGPAPAPPLFDPTAARATHDYNLVLDGGAGNDWVFAVGGEKVTTAGGLGRDLIYNSSKGGIIWGDVANSLLEVATDRRYTLEVDSNGKTTDIKDYIADDASNADNFVWAPGTTIEDPQYNDILTFFGIPLVNPTDNGGAVLSLGAFGNVGQAIGLTQILTSPLDSVYVDEFLPFITYSFKGEADGSYDLIVQDILTSFLDAADQLLGGNSGAGSLSAALKKYYGAVTIKDYIPAKNHGQVPVTYFGSQDLYLADHNLVGKLGMVFKKTNPITAILALLPPTLITTALSGGGALVEEVLELSASVERSAKALSWYAKTDPLVLDLSGEGLVTTSLDQSSVHFDFGNDLFANRTGWLSGNEGFLVLDKNGNGIIDNASEMFGLTTGSGFLDLAAYDTNHDDVIDANDAIFAKLQVWVDANGDGITDPGELHSLSDLGIVSISLNSLDLGDSTTSDGTTLTAASSFTYADGTSGQIYDAIFPTDPTDTVYEGQTGAAPWTGAAPIDARGFGHVTNLAIATANDFDLAHLVATTASTMTTPNLRTLVDQAAPILGGWGETLNQTAELDPVLLGTDASGKTVLLDRAIYVEDATGGYWTLQSGNPVLDAAGNVIARPTMQDVLAQSVPAGEDWQLTQMWSPSTRATPLQFRTDAPYLTKVVDGRVMVLDYGIQNADGSWRLASGTPVLDAQGNVVAAPTIADVLAQTPPAGDAWRSETIGFNPLASITVKNIGLDVVNGAVVDYTVQMTDQDGTFYVWARNLDRALALQAKQGNARAFNLRNYELNFADLQQQVDSTDNSTYRIELMTPAEFNFALELDGIRFEPQLLAGSIDKTTGIITYAVNDQGDVSLSSTGYVSGIQQTIGLVNSVFDEYVTVSRATAVRIALQGGLSQFAQGIAFDDATGKYTPTTSQQLAPMLEAIFNAAPRDNSANAIATYLANWNDILWQVYPDYQISAGDTISGGSVAFDQVFLLQQIIEAFENSSINYDIAGIANALSVDQSKIVLTPHGGGTVQGTSGTDYFYITPGNATYEGGPGSDYYFVGKNPGNDTIVDYGRGEVNELVFTSLNADDVTATREGEDLLLTVVSTGAVIRLKDEFLGELNDYYSTGKQQTSGVDSILFEDGTVWDRFQMAFEVAHPINGDISVIGSGSADVLWAGKGSQYLSGGAGGDIYIVAPGDGATTIDDEGAFSLGPVKAGLDILDFQGGLTASNLRLTRQGESDDLLITEVDANGIPTGDTVLIKNQFRDIVLNLGVFASLLGTSSSDKSLEFVAPDQIERFIFSDGTSLDFEQIIAEVIQNNETAGDDVVYGSATDDTFDGGAGNDYLSGEAGSDTYIFGRGYGQDIVEDDDESSHFFGDPYTDVLKFTDLRWSDLTFIRNGDSQDLTFQITGTTEQVTIPDFTKTDPLGFTQPNRIEQFVFGDGTTWRWQEALQHFIDAYATAGNDALYGFGGLADELGFTFDGGAGDDLLEGHSGADTYIFGRGYGNDTILDAGGNDTLVLKGLASTDVTFSRTALDLIITINDTGETVTLKDQYVRANEQQNAIENFQFTDTTLSYTQYNPDRMPVITTSFGETLEGSDFAETLDGRGGNATLIGHDGGDTYLFDIGYGNETIIDQRTRASWDDRPKVKIPVDDSVRFGADIGRDDLVFTKDGEDLVISIKGRTDTLRIKNQFRSLDDQIEYFRFYDDSAGTPDYLTAADVAEMLQVAAGNIGDNVIVGLPDQPNVLDGGPGDDTLVGGNAADTYVFSTGYNLDTIEETQDQPGVEDQVVFGATVKPDAIKLTRNGTNLSIDIGDGTDVLTITDGLGTHSVEKFLFADGTVWTIEDIKTKLLIGTAGDDQIIGFDNRNDVLDGGKGSDYLAGGSGDDTYLFGQGDGADAIYDTAGNDTLAFKAGVTQDEVTFVADGDNLVVKLSSGDTIVVLSGLAANPVETFVFDGGKGPTLTLDQVKAEILAAKEAYGNQSIDLTAVGSGITFDAKPNDTITVSEASTVTFRAGTGASRILLPANYGYWWYGYDLRDYKIEFPDLASTQVTVRVVDKGGNDVQLVFSTGDRISLPSILNGGPTVTLQFADGVTWTNAQLGAALVADQIATNAPLILGTSGNDTIDAGFGTHEIVGNGGDDTFLFHRGDGTQTISDSSGGNNVLRVAGYTATDVTVHRLIPDENILVLSFIGTDDRITLNYDIGRDGVTSVTFDDGTSLSAQQLFAATVGRGTDGDDVMTGTADPEVFVGGKGNDTIIGGGGADVYVFNRGDGQDTIESNGTPDGLGTLAFGAGIAKSDIVATRDSGGDIVLSLAGSSDRVTLVTPPQSTHGVVAGVTFADGTSWSYADIALSVAVSDDGDQINVPSEAGATPVGVKITGGDGNDHIQGGDGDDILVGGKGDDTLSGGKGSDTYYFSLGDGQDTIVDNGTYGANENRLVFGAGISAGNLSFSISGGDLVVKVGAGNDRITIVGMTSNPADVIEQFVFADGTILTADEVLADAAAPQPATLASQGTLVADAVTDFSTSHNPNGSWAYGEGVGGVSFTPFVVTGTVIDTFDYWQSSSPSSGVPLIGENESSDAQSDGTAVYPAHALIMHPGVSDDAIMRWTATIAGDYDFTGSFALADIYPSGVIGEVFDNERENLFRPADRTRCVVPVDRAI